MLYLCGWVGATLPPHGLSRVADFFVACREDKGKQLLLRAHYSLHVYLGWDGFWPMGVWTAADLQVRANGHIVCAVVRWF